MFHLVTAGWNVITNGPEGEFAGTASVLLSESGWSHEVLSGAIHQGPPLGVWLSRVSMHRLGVSEFSARLPGAVAVACLVWLTFRLAEGSGSTWRGFVAAMVVSADR